jgi:hypothetical protein
MASKRWSEDHVRLACSAVDVRDRLRNMARSLPGEQAQILGECAAVLTAGLKARTKKLLRDGGKTPGGAVALNPIVRHTRDHDQTTK